MIDDTIIISGSPPIPGLRFRHFRGKSDFPHMAAVIAASADADHIERVTTAEDIAESYTHLTNSNPYQDMIFAELDGQVIGYSRLGWHAEEHDVLYLYSFIGFLVPAWRQRGIGRAILQWIENRSREIAAEHPAESAKVFQVFVTQFEVGLAALLEKEGYHPIRYSNEMVRPSLEDIPDFSLPSGLEVRPVLPEHYRLIWDAATEAFRDHWGFSLPTEDDYQGWLSDKIVFQPELWQVAWDTETNQVAGQVRTFIDHAQNEKYNRRRGYTEFISVRRPWRKRGLARALIVRSLQVQREQGMVESALGADSENLSGAIRIYEDCGFQVVKRNAIYRKSL
jgi:mycothiol synthase